MKTKQSTNIENIKLYKKLLAQIESRGGDFETRTENN